MYARINWKDEVRNPDKTFSFTDNGDGTMTFARAGRQIQAGTNQNAVNLGAMDAGIEAANLAVNLLFSYVGMKLGFSDLSMDGMLAALNDEIAKITGGDTVAAKAVTLTQILGVLLGGTGASTAAGARTNLDVPSNADLKADAILQKAIECTTQAYQRDLDARVTTIEAGLA